MRKYLLLIMSMMLATNALAFDATKATRYPSPDMYRPNVDQLLINNLPAVGGSAPDNSNKAATTSFVQALAAATVVGPYLSDTNCGADQTSRINALASSLQPGAWLIFPRSGCISISGSLINTKQRWTGSNSISGTEFRYSGATGDAFVLMGDDAMLEHVRVNNIGATTSSQGIRMSDGVENPIRQKLNNIYVTGFTNGIDVESGYLWAMDHVEVRNFANYGAVLRNRVYCDNGDWSMVDFTARNDFTPQVGSAGIRYESGGGGKVVNSKLLGSQFGVDLAFSDTCLNPGKTGAGAAGTGDFNISNTSIENQSVMGMRFAAGTTAKFGSITVTGVELAGQPTAIGIYPGVYGVTISGNTMTAVNYGTQVFGGDIIGISSNTYTNTGVAAVDLHDGATNVNVGPNTYKPLALGSHTVLDQRTSDTGPVYYNDRRKLALNQSANYTPVYELDTGTFRSTKIDVQVEGQIVGVGSVSRFVSVMLTNNNGSVEVTPILDKNSTKTIDVNLDTTTTPNAVIVGVRPNATVAGGNFVGSVTVKADGMLVGFKPLI